MSASTRCLRFFLRGLGALKVQLDFTAAGEDSGLYVGKLLVNRRGAGVDGGLSGMSAMRSMRVAMWRSGSVAARRGRTASSNNGLSSLGGPGSRIDDLTDGRLQCGVDVLAGRGAVTVG